MSRLLNFLAVIAFASIAAAQYEYPATQIKIVKTIESYVSQNPGVVVFPLKASRSVRGQIRYTLGNRIIGDRAVAQGSNSYQYPTLQDIQLTLSYPQSGIGAVVTYIDILVNQSSNLGNAYIISGGIGQRHISILVEAKSTSFFQYNANIYGY